MKVELKRFRRFEKSLEKLLGQEKPVKGSKVKPLIKAIQSFVSSEREKIESLLSEQERQIETLGVELTRYENRVSSLEIEVMQLSQGGYGWK